MNIQTAALLQDKAELMQGLRKKRMHVYADHNANIKIRSEVKRLGVSISDYIIYVALFFKTDDIPEKLDEALRKLKKVSSAKHYKLNKEAVKSLTEKYKKGENIMSDERKEINEEATNDETVKAGQFHLRVTQEVYDEIKKKAATFSMSVSDYVVFVVNHFDIMDISNKIDEINAKLDTITESKE